MPLIVQKIDKAMEIGAEMFIRPLACGVNWTKLRIGVRLAMYGTADITAGMLMGFCDGTVDYDDANVDLVGGHMGSAVFATTFQYVAGTPNYYTLFGTSYLGLTKVGSTVATIASGGVNWITPAEPTKAYTVWIIDVTKTSPGWTIRQFIPTTPAVGQAHRTREVFLTWLTNESTAGGVLTNGGSTVPAYTGNYQQDSVFFKWVKSSNPVTIADMSVIRLV